MANPKIVFEGVDRASVVVNKVADGVGKLQLALSTIAGAAAVGVFKSIVDDLDRLEESAQSAGVTVESLSALRYAATFAGVGAEELDDALKKLNVQLVAAAGGGKEAQAIFRALGIAVQNSSGQVLSSDEALGQIADKFASFRDGPEKAALAVEIFGRSGTKLIPFLNQGSSGLQRLREEAERLGIVIGGDATAAASKFSDQLDRLAASGRAASTQTFLPLITWLGNLVEEFEAATRAGQGFREVMGFTFKYFNLTEAEAAAAIAAVNEKIDERRRIIDAAEQQTGRLLRIDATKAKQEMAQLQREKAALQQIQATRRNAEIGPQYGNEGRQALGVAPRVAKGGGGDGKEAIDEQRLALARFVDELQREADKLEDITTKEKILRFLRANPSIDTAQVREALAAQEQILDLRLRAVAAKKEDEEIERRIVAQLKATDEQLDAFSGRVADALKMAQTARLEARLAAGEIFTSEELDKMVKGIAGIKDEVEKVNDEAKSLALTFASSIGRFIEDPKGTSFFKALGQDIQKLIVQLLIVKPLAEGLEALFSGKAPAGGKGQASIGGSFLSIIMSFFGGLFAEGGTLGRGQWGIAGERGPELIYGGTSGLTVLPAGRGGGTTVNVYIDGATDRARVASYVQAGVAAGLARSADSRARGGSGVR